jgi:hypothetical protein
MALPPSETFIYVVKVPKEKGPDSFPWQLELGEEIEPSGDALFDDRLLGYSPLLWVTDGGITADPFGLRDEVRVSRFTLRAMNQKNASHREVSFQIDGELTKLFQVDDELRLRHSGMWGTGLTLLRTGKLVFAVGAIGGSKLGSDIRMGLPEDALERIHRFDRVPFEKKMRKVPLLLPFEIYVGKEMRSIYAGRVEMGNYGIWVEGGTNHAYPSGDSYAAIWAKGLCDEWCAIASALMLRPPGMEIIDW